MRRRGFAAAVISAALVSGCTATKQFADIGFRPPAGSYSLIVMRPDVSVGLLTAGGEVEARKEWTDQARANLLKALSAQQAGRGGTTKIAATREETGADPEMVADLDRLHQAVGAAIRLHKYGPFQLPTKAGKFDWTLGEQAVRFGQASHFDYALFLHVEDSFSSSGRVALQAVALMGCMVGVCVMPHGGQQAAYASLVDLKTGQIVWFNQLSSSVGDVRTEDGAKTMITQLLDRMKPGADARKAGTKA
jgi:hypothetical protein